MVIDMELLRLKGVTGHGKNRIREHGEEWLVLDHSSPIRSEIFIESIKTGDRRWLTKDFAMK